MVGMCSLPVARTVLSTCGQPTHSEIPHDQMYEQHTVYRRIGFDCEYLLNEFFQDSQSFEHAIINLTIASTCAIIEFVM